MIEKPLFWHQGLFLQPQHLQLNDLKTKSLLTPYHKEIKKYLTGTSRLTITQSSLNEYVFQINSGEFWFKDGTYVVLGENAKAESRSFKNIWVNSSAPMKVYVGLRKFSNVNENVTVIKPGQPLQGVLTRFVSDENSKTVNDLHQKGNPAEVKRLCYNVKIFFEPEIETLSDYDLIPVATIVRNTDEIKLDDDYIPPCLTITSIPALSRLTREIHDKLSFKGRELSSYKKRRGIHNAEFGSRDMVYLLALRTLNRYLPIFIHMDEEKQIHPLDYYKVLRQIIGELSSFSEMISVSGEDASGKKYVKQYDHENIGECFSGASEVLGMLIDEITSGPDYIIELKKSDFEFRAFLKPEIFDSNNSYYLVIRTNTDAAGIVEAVESEVKLSSVNVMPMLVQKSIPGIRIDYLSIPPHELPRRSDSHYFRIDASGNYWKSIKTEKAVACYWETAPEDIRIEMMVVRRK